MLVKIEEIQEPGLKRTEPIKPEVLNVALADSEGFVLVSSSPLSASFKKVSGRVFVNGVSIGVGSELLLPRLGRGPVTVRVEASGYRTWTNTFASAAEVPTNFDVALSRAP